MFPKAPPAARVRVLHVNPTHAKATDSGKGTEGRPLRTINKAAQLAQPGDTVLIHAGVYRERVAPPRGGEEGRPITYQAAQRRAAILKGSELWRPVWERFEGAILRASLDAELFEGANPFKVRAKRIVGHMTLGQLFINGEPVRQVDTLEMLRQVPGAWMAAEEGAALLLHPAAEHGPLEAQTLEITTRDRIFAPHLRGLGHIQVRGLVMEHCANQFPSGFWEKEETVHNGAPQAGALGCRSGHHWVIEDNIIRHANAVAIDCGEEGGHDIEGNQPAPDLVGYHRICNNHIADAGACGIAGYRAVGTHMIGNIIERTNVGGWTAPESAAIKCHFFYDGLIAGNLIRDNDCFGIWLDNVWYGARVTGNLVVSNSSGIFVELGDGPCLVDHNIVAFSRSEGIYMHDTSGATVAHNLLFGNAHFGVYARMVSERATLLSDGSRAMAGCSRLRILNNVFVDNYRGHMCLPLPSEHCRDNVSDYNLLINGTMWHWEGLGFHKFVLGRNDHRTPMEDLTAALNKALDALGADTANRPGAEWFKELPYVPLEVWRAMTGNDTHSVAPSIRQGAVENGAVERGGANFAMVGLYFELRAGDVLRSLWCPRVEGTDRDWYGRALPEAPLAGPFQEIKEGHNRFVLWPRPAIECPPLPEPRPERDRA